MPPQWVDLDSEGSLLKYVVQKTQTLGRNRKWFPGTCWPQSCWVSLGVGENLTSSMGWFLEGRAGFYGETRRIGWQRVLATWESHLLPLPGVSFVLVQELLMQHQLSPAALPWQGICVCLAGQHHSSARSGQALLAVKSPGIARQKCRLHSASPADVKITWKTSS